VVRVASWNINNIVKRLKLLCNWLAQAKPDVLDPMRGAPPAGWPAGALPNSLSRAVGCGAWALHAPPPPFEGSSVKGRRGLRRSARDTVLRALHLQPRKVRGAPR